MWLANLGHSEHLGSGWKGQYARVLRWHQRITSLGALDDATPAPFIAFDYLYAFFQNCFHLRDWLKNDGAVSEKSLRSFMSGNIEMAVCRDIANGTKHFRINRPSVDALPSIGREYHPPDSIGKRAGTTESYFVILEDRTSHAEVRFDLQDLADKCVNSWQTLLRTEGLL